MSTLSDIMAQIASVTGKASITELGDDRKYLNRAPPRITWVPMSESIEPARQQEVATKTSVLERNALVNLHIWGTTLEEAEYLYHLHLAAIVDELSHVAFEIGTAEWTELRLVDKGREVIVPVTLKIPVYSLVEYTTVDITAATLTAGTMTDSLGDNPEQGAP